ncbi:hypothetical protein P7M41_26235 [Vibrio parahaemolyticus]|nr:hypothetical protein [Vibrio parahaemolyticus]
MSEIRIKRRTLKAVISISSIINNEENEIINDMVKDLGPDVDELINDFDYMFKELIEYIPEEEKEYYIKQYKKSRGGYFNY